MNRFFQGMMYLIMGLRTLSTKGLKRFIILPIAFNLLLFAGLFYLIYYYLSPYTYYYLDKLPSWLGFLSWVFFVLFA
ncbi:MAG: sulfate transporter CysZ, partial [Legionella sp.]|nr:sulfate transporter CysZ [Legionella sp.]